MKRNISNDKKKNARTKNCFSLLHNIIVFVFNVALFYFHTNCISSKFINREVM